MSPLKGKCTFGGKKGESKLSGRHARSGEKVHTPLNVRKKTTMNSFKRKKKTPYREPAEEGRASPVGGLKGKGVHSQRTGGSLDSLGKKRRTYVN